MSAHTKCIHIKLEHGFFFLTFMVFFFTQTNNGPYDLAVKPRTLQFRVNFLDIVADGLFSSSRRSMRSMKARNWPTAMVWASLVMSSLTGFSNSARLSIKVKGHSLQEQDRCRKSDMVFLRVAGKIKSRWGTKNAFYRVMAVDSGQSVSLSDVEPGLNANHNGGFRGFPAWR